MKKPIHVLLLLLCLSVQSLGMALTDFGFRASYGVSNYVGEDTFLTNISVDEHFVMDNFRPSWSLSVFYEKSLTPLFDIRSELNLQNKGSKGKYRQDNNNPIDVTYELRYLEVPVLLKLNLPLYQLYTGPFVSFLMASDIRISQKRESWKDHTNNADFGGIIGIQKSISPKLSMDLRYTQGVANVYDLDTGFPKLKNYTVSVGLVGTI